MYYASIGRFHCIDPSSETYEAWTPYNYVANNPILLIDPFGTDWFYYSVDGQADPTWNWKDASEYNHTYTYTDDDGNEQTGSILLRGVQAAMVFDGTGGETMGEGPGSLDNLYGEGSNLATVTVYGPGGADDIQTYEGWTKSSNPTGYGMVADGIYSGTQQSFTGSNNNRRWFIDNGLGTNGDQLPVWTPSFNSEVAFSNPLFSSRSPGYKDEIFVHTTLSASGNVGSQTTLGCLLIAPGRNGDFADWNRFNNQMSGAQNFAVQINRGMNYTITNANTGQVIFNSQPRFWGRGF